MMIPRLIRRAAVLLALPVLLLGIAGVASASASSAGVGWVRLAHFSPNTPAVDVYLHLDERSAAFFALGLAQASLQSFPVEFVQGMKARGKILGDVGRNSPDHWDLFWQQDPVHVWLGVYAGSSGELDQKTHEIAQLAANTGGADFTGMQNAGLLVVNGQTGQKEHFGYTDGFGNPDYLGVQRDTQPGQGKLSPDGKSWLPLATGELLLGYEAQNHALPLELPHASTSSRTPSACSISWR